MEIFMKPAKRKKNKPVRGHLTPSLCSSAMAGSGGMLRRRRRVSRSWILVCCRGCSRLGVSSTGEVRGRGASQWDEH